MDMENVKDASFESYKKRKLFTYLYAGDKLTMLSTFVVSKEKWGYTLIREAIIPRTWNVRLKWLKVMDLIFFTKVDSINKNKLPTINLKRRCLKSRKKSQQLLKASIMVGHEWNRVQVLSTCPS